MKISRSSWETPPDLTEAMPEFLQNNPRYMKYFKIIRNHQPVSAVRDNAMYVYCSGVPRISVKVEKVVSITSSTSQICLDQTFNFVVHNEKAEGISPAIRFRIKRPRTRGYYYDVGFFLIDKKTLITADLTHYNSETSIAVMKRILNYLIKHKYVSIIPGKRRLKKINRSIVPLRLTIGSDPEFEYFDGCAVQNASYTEFGEGDDRCQRQWGTDGAGDQIEGRPDPATSVTEAVENMRELFREVTHVRMLVQGDRYPLGGHLHLGGISFVPSYDSKLLKLYDNMIGEPTKRMNGSARGSYCRMGAYETKSYGFEYRTPPAGIFYTPRMLALCYKIMLNTARKWYSGEELDFASDFTVNLKKWADFTDEEITEYKDLIDGYEEHCHKNVMSLWLPPEELTEEVRRIPKFRFRISISTEDVFSDRLRGELSSMEVNGSRPNLRLYFYGLKKERGDVIAGITYPGYRQIPDVTGTTGSRQIAIGLPYELRQITDDAEIGDLLTAIKEQIEGRF